VWPLIID
jgi:hypothetical protein